MWEALRHPHRSQAVQLLQRAEGAGVRAHEPYVRHRTFGRALAEAVTTLEQRARRETLYLSCCPARTLCHVDVLVSVVNERLRRAAEAESEQARAAAARAGCAVEAVRTHGELGSDGGGSGGSDEGGAAVGGAREEGADGGAARARRGEGERGQAASASGGGRGSGGERSDGGRDGGSGRRVGRDGGRHGGESRAEGGRGVRGDGRQQADIPSTQHTPGHVDTWVLVTELLGTHRGTRGAGVRAMQRVAAVNSTATIALTVRKHAPQQARARALYDGLGFAVFYRETVTIDGRRHVIDWMWAHAAEVSIRAASLAREISAPELQWRRASRLTAHAAEAAAAGDHGELDERERWRPCGR